MQHHEKYYIVFNMWLSDTCGKCDAMCNTLSKYSFKKHALAFMTHTIDTEYCVKLNMDSRIWKDKLYSIN